MNDPHQPDPEFARFLEWQTRTELRRRDRFEAPRGALPSVPRPLRATALVLVSLLIGGGSVLAMERLQDSREQAAQLERNRLLLALAERRVVAAEGDLQEQRRLYEQGVIGPVDVEQAEARRAQHERERAHLGLDAEELLAGGSLERGPTAPSVGRRDFVREHLQIEREFADQEWRRAQRAEQLARERVERGVVSQEEWAQAEHLTQQALRRVTRIDERLALRADFVAGHLSIEACTARDLLEDARHRRADLTAQLERVRHQLAREERLAAAGFSPGPPPERVARLEELQVELKLVEVELDLLR